MAYYVNIAASSDALTREIKDLVPDPAIRRRMSRVVKMGVATGMEALASLPDGTPIDAIITATRLGCLADSEKFLRNVVEGETAGSDSGPALLNPTPFIQSTFNTVGAQIAMLTRNHCYNMTYVHGERSFGSALVDAAIRIDQTGARHVLLGLFDEITPTLQRIGERMRGAKDFPTRDGAWFFVISTRPLPGCAGEVETLNEQSFERWVRL
jgi:3-oxoacyl-(acyl-carrier-protein) synthase